MVRCRVAMDDLAAENHALREQLAATSEILRVINQSTSDVEPVLQAIVDGAMRLCEGVLGAVYQWDGERVTLLASRNFPAPARGEMQRGHQQRMTREESSMIRCVEERVVINIGDALAPEAPPFTRQVALAGRYRSLLLVPMMRTQQCIGVIGVSRESVGRFTDAQVDLLRTFADQAAIAVENARLFHELGQKSHELEIANRHKSEFLANMSHELRTPLNAIIGCTEMLSEGPHSDDEKEMLDRVLRASRHLHSLINDILDLTKIEAGRMDLDLSEFNLAASVESVVTLLRERAQRKRLALCADVSPQVRTIRADERKVHQVLLNLLSNALKFTPDGGRIDVRARGADHMVEVAVSDTGIGIAPEDQDAVFEEFRQVGQPGAKAEGTGLGLALAREIVELHGGTIRVVSTPGVGSTFTFTLPRG